MIKPLRVVLFLALITLTPHTLFALSVDPAVVELRADVGQTVKGTISVDTSRDGVNVEVLPFTIDAAGNSRSDETASLNVGWIKTVSQVKKTKKNGRRIEVPFEIKVTNNSVAEYTAKLQITEQMESKKVATNNYGIEIGLAFGIPIYVSVPALETHAIAVDSFSFSKAKNEATLVLRNDGSVQDRPVVTYVLYKYGGFWPFVSRDKVGSGDITRVWPILGKMTRSFAKPMTLTSGDYEIELTINYGMRYGFKGNLQQTIPFSVH